MLLFLLLAAGVSACNVYNDLFARWNVVAEQNLALYRSDFEGKTWVGNVATLQNFALGEKLYYQCTGDYVLNSAKVNANSGNFCGGKVATSSFSGNLVGSNANCKRAGNRDCGHVFPIPFDGNVSLAVVAVTDLLG